MGPFVQAAIPSSRVRSRRRWAGGLLATALAAALLPPLVAPAPPASANVLVKQTATLTQSISGMPAPSADAGRQIQRAHVVIEHPSDSAAASISATVTLKATPTNDPDAVVRVGLGRLSGNTCEFSSSHSMTDVTSSFDGPVYPQHAVHVPPAGSWNCVVAIVEPIDGTTDYDVMVGPLANSYARPRLAVGAVTLLGAKQKVLRMVRGVPTPYWVTVRNPGKVRATGVVLRVKGKGVKAPRVRVGRIAPGRKAQVRVPIRLTSRKKTKVKLVVTGNGVRAARTLTARPVAPPARPRPGTYRSKNGVTFKVQSGRIVGWRGRMRTRCGGYPGNITYTMNTYDFPRTRIPRNGIIDARARGTNYGTTLRMRIAGGKATRGLFTYSGPNRCFASTSFTATRR